VNVYLTTFLFAIASALVPILNIEAFIAGLSAIDQVAGLWVLSFTAGLGQAVGKVFWYEVGRSSMNWAYIRRKMESPGWQTRYDKVKALVDERPWTGLGVLFFSAVAGVPPLAVIAVLAGQLRLSRTWFYLLVVVGRTLRFAVVVASFDYLRHTGLF
jgi:membrane protein YqaA with SNARE-associated domain